jgi:hypothetical protein
VSQLRFASKASSFFALFLNRQELGAFAWLFSCQGAGLVFTRRLTVPWETLGSDLTFRCEAIISDRFGFVKLLFGGTWRPGRSTGPTRCDDTGQQGKPSPGATPTYRGRFFRPAVAETERKRTEASPSHPSRVVARVRGDGLLVEQRSRAFR